jgi:hypothetical protein
MRQKSTSVAHHVRQCKDQLAHDVGQIFAPWDRSDFGERWTAIPWAVQYDKSLRLGDREVYAEYSAHAFVHKTNAVRLSAKVVSTLTGASRRFVQGALQRLSSAGHLEPIRSKTGKITAYRLTHKLFASKHVILTTKEGTQVIDRQQLEDLRKRLKVSHS